MYKVTCPPGTSTRYSGGRINYSSSCKCPSNKVWNSNENKCVTCPYPTNLTYSGEPISYIPNCKCPSGYKWNNGCYDPNKNAIRCPPGLSSDGGGGDSPWTLCSCPSNNIWSTDKCDLCETGEYYFNKICKKCNKGTYNDTKGGTCRDCPVGQTTLNVGSNSNLLCIDKPIPSSGSGSGSGSGIPLSCTGGQILDVLTSTCNCPVGLTWSGTNCLDCSGGRILSGNQCVCPTGTEWYNNMCITCPKNTSVTNTGGPHETYPSCKCPDNSEWSKWTQSCNPCPDTSSLSGRGGKIGTGFLCACPAGQQWKDGKCQLCNEGEELVDNECKLCPVNTFNDTKGGVCRNCPGNQITLSTGQTSSNRCSCPLGYTLSSNGITCESITCSNGKILDNTTGTCVCPTGSTWDSVSSQCICSGGRILSGNQCVCPSPLNWNNNQCVCPGGGVWNGSQCTCPQTATLWSGSGCTCAPDAVVTSDGGRCECPGGQIWDSIKLKCECPAGSNWDGTKCICPVGSNWNGSTCITCSGDQTWDTQSLSCVCPEGTNWNGSSCTCTKGIYVSQDFNRLGANDIGGHIAGKCFCPINYGWDPNGKTCVKCTDAMQYLYQSPSPYPNGLYNCGGCGPFSRMNLTTLGCMYP